MRPEAIESLRKNLGLTQARLAAITGVHAMTVSKWERGVLEPAPFALRILETLRRSRTGASPAAVIGELVEHLNRALIDASEVSGMKLSASNQLKGKITQIDEGPVTSRVIIRVAPGVEVCSLITTASVRRLKLKVGKAAIAIIKATEVIVATH